MTPEQIGAMVDKIYDAVNGYLVKEFSLTQPFQEDPANGERYGVFDVSAWSRRSQDTVAVPGKIWLIEGFENHDLYTKGALKLAGWLECRIPAIRSVIRDAGVRQLFTFYLGNYSDGGNSYPIEIPVTKSSRIQNAKQKANWQATLVCPVTVNLTIKQCI